MMRDMSLRLTSLEAALAELDALAAADGPDVGDGWSVYRVAHHCKQSIDASIDGYPAMKPAIVRATIGRLVARRFLSKGQMRHDLTSPVPGAEAIAEDGDAAAAITALRESIARFRAHDGELAPHFVFGNLDKADYDKLHAMHIADHLSAIRYG
jgi:hypothetical protein